MQKEITIIITTFNSEKYILNQLNSLKNQLFLFKKEKNLNKFNFLILDDCSIDNTVPIIKGFLNNLNFNMKITLHVNKKNLGIAENRRKIISLISTNFFIFLDVDDILNLSRFLNIKLNENKIYIPWRIIIFDKNNFSNLNLKIKNKIIYFSMNYWNICGIIFSKKIYSKISFLPNKNMGEDVNSFALISNNKCCFIKSNIPLYFHLHWKNSLSNEDNLNIQRRIKNLEEFVSNIINTIDKINNHKHLDIIQARFLSIIYNISKNLNYYVCYKKLLGKIFINKKTKITKKILVLNNKPIKNKFFWSLINKKIFFLYFSPKVANFYLKIIFLKRKKIIYFIHTNSFFLK